MTAMIVRATANPIDDAPPAPLHRFSVEDYHRLLQAGVFAEDEAVELLEGWIVQKMVRSPLHDATVEMVLDALRFRVPEGWRVRSQSAVTTSDSEPEPDAAVVAGPVSAHMENHPAPRELALVVEVSDATLSRDRGIKLRLYARAGIAAYWIVNLPERVVEVHLDPSGDTRAPGYGTRRVYRPQDTIELPIGQTTVQVPVAEFLQPAGQ